MGLDPTNVARTYEPLRSQAIRYISRRELSRLTAVIDSQGRVCMEKPPISPEMWQTFLLVLAETGNIAGSAEAAGLHSEKWVDDYVKEKPDRREEMMEAKAKYGARVASVLRRRALEGDVEFVYHNGAVVGKKRRFSDRLLLAEARAHMPNTYREEGSVNVDVRVQSGVLVAPTGSYLPPTAAKGEVDRDFVEEAKLLPSGAPVASGPVVPPVVEAPPPGEAPQK